jgi:hypothetical protein
MEISIYLDTYMDRKNTNSITSKETMIHKTSFQAALGKYWILGLVSSVIVLTPSIALANHWIDTVRAQLVQAAIALNLDGDYELTHDPYGDTLSSRQNDSLLLNLDQGIDYAIVGVCDQDCRDIDLRLYDQNGNLIDSDTGYDDYPYIRVTPRWTGRFKLKVSMVSCSSNPCYYGIGTFGR